MRGCREPSSRSAGWTRIASILALACLFGLAAAGPGAGRAEANLPAGFFGVDTALTPSAQAFHQMHANGVETFRIAVQWPEVERVPPTDVGGYQLHHYDWRRPDAEMRLLLAAGLRPHVTLIGSPSWVAPTYATSPMRSAAGRRGWPAFVDAVVARYGPGGTFWAANPDLPVRPPDAYQIWNEPNSQIAYAPVADPKQYAVLFRLAGKRIRARDPKAAILPGGMFGTPQLSHSLYAWKFLSQFLHQPAIGDYVDGIAVHPYANNLRGVKYQIRKMRKAAHDAGFGSLPLYVTEIGWSSEKPNGNIFFKGVKGQAKTTRKALGLLIRNQRKWNLRRVLWFTWSDLTQQQTYSSGCGFCKETGLVDVNLKPKPALLSWRHFALP